MQTSKTSDTPGRSHAVSGADRAEARLYAEFAERQARNPAYSLRAFGRTLGIPAGRLTQYFAGQRRITPAMAERIAARLPWSPAAARAFLAAVGGRAGATRSPGAGGAPDPYTLTGEADFQVIASWEHFAILSVLKLDGFRPEPEWIAARLGIPVRTCRAALKRLLRTGLIAEADGTLVRRSANLRTTDQMASRALRLSHAQSLRQAIAALDEVPVELRDISSITMPVSLARLAGAKDRIKAFRRELAAYMESGAADEVYNLNIQLVPVTRPAGQDLTIRGNQHENAKRHDAGRGGSRRSGALGGARDRSAGPPGDAGRSGGRRR